MRILLCLSLSLLAVACSDSAPEPQNVAQPVASIEPAPLNTETSSSYEQAHAAAVAAIQISADKGHAWNTADQLLKDAEKASADGDEALAISLADEARMQADIASMQADTEAATWHKNVITD